MWFSPSDSLTQYLEDFKIFCEQHLESNKARVDAWDMEHYLDVMESFHVISLWPGMLCTRLLPGLPAVEHGVESKPYPPSQICHARAGLTALY